ncbi:MAG TPA: hypothetical protein VIR16_11695, partial [Candidatus Limnocylindrales bacterium]
MEEIELAGGGEDDGGQRAGADGEQEVQAARGHSRAPAARGVGPRVVAGGEGGADRGQADGVAS